jgi:hypothetical protein
VGKQSVFFFEKKNQKTFANWSVLYPERSQPKAIKSFLLLFFKKEVLSA